MPAQDTSKLKQNIMNFLRNRGPSLPVHIAKEIQMDILFASAFLSELLSEGKIKTSNMKVGSSRLHFLPGQEEKLANFSQYLKSKEKDAFELLKQKRFLKDSETEPAIRVALRAIKDFAIPLNKNNDTIWRYFTESKSNIPQEQEKPKKQEIINTPETEKQETVPSKPNKPLEIKKKPAKKTTKTSRKKDDKFFNQVKQFLLSKNIEILDIQGFSRKDLMLKVKKDEKERILIAYNKKTINEKDIINANKKASEIGLKYIILSLGNPLKKTQTLLDAAKNLTSIEKIE